MCAIFGFIDVRNAFTSKDREKIIRSLAVHSEIRGTDATGFAYNSRGYLNIVKRPVAAHKMKLRLPTDSTTIIGHTRMTTQGNARSNYNNHPFMGAVGTARFALTHNGIINNDTTLRTELKLPKTKIKTDSYIAVQLIEKQKTLDFGSIKFMSEQVSGIFTFAILDNNGNVWLVKGDNPVCIYYNKKYGFYIFASTQEILQAALKSTGLQNLNYKEVEMSDGEMLKISASGSIQRSTFELPRYSYRDKFGYYNYLDELDWCDTTDIVQLKEAAGMFGVTKEEVDFLLDYGFFPEEVEIMLNSPYELNKAFYEASYGELAY